MANSADPDQTEIDQATYVCSGMFLRILRVKTVTYPVAALMRWSWRENWLSQEAYSLVHVAPVAPERCSKKKSWCKFLKIKEDVQ